MAGRSPLLRLQPDEKLVALTRRGQHGAFEALVQRYQSRLLAFCRHMLGSQEDAEDVLQEVFTSAFNAMIADERSLNVRPWLYRIARNRCLNHLRRPVPAGQDSMDIFERDGGTTTADTVHKREEFRQIVADVQDLPETQRTALLLREIDALSYEQIAEAMETTVPSVKSLLVRARVSLAEAAEARLLTCAEVRLELGQVAEGIAKSSAPVRRHLKNCERCRVFKRELRQANRALAAVYPISAFVLFKKVVVAKLGLGGAAGSGAAAGGSAAATAGGLAGSAAVTAGSVSAGSAVSAGVGTLASKAAATVAAAAIVTAGAVEVKEVSRPHPVASQAVVAPAPKRAPNPVTAAAAAPVAAEKAIEEREPEPAPEPKLPEPDPILATPAEPVPAPEPVPVAQTPPAEPEPTGVHEDGSTVALPAEPAPAAGEETPTTTTTPEEPTPGEQEPAAEQNTPPGEPAGEQGFTEPAPPAGEPTPTEPAPAG